MSRQFSYRGKTIAGRSAWSFILAMALIAAAVVLATAALRPAVLTGVAAAAGYVFPDYIPELPHGGFSATSNKCKICHALHGPDEDAFHLIRHAYQKVTFWGGCEQCHYKGSSFTVKYVYTFTNFLGEHTIGASKIPDSKKTLPELAFNPGLPIVADQEVRNAEGRNPDYYTTYKTLRCLSCHSPHANQVMGGSKILRQDPARDGGMAQNYTEFCSDCHDQNVVAKKSHPTVGDGRMEVSGGAGGAPSKNKRVAYVALEGCTSCHTGATLAEGGQFPHQSNGNKLLTDSYQVAPDLPAGQTGDPLRPLPNMDQVCLGCHRNDTNTKGVGKDF